MCGGGVAASVTIRSLTIGHLRQIGDGQRPRCVVRAWTGAENKSPLRVGTHQGWGAGTQILLCVVRSSSSHSPRRRDVSRWTADSISGSLM